MRNIPCLSPWFPPLFFFFIVDNCITRQTFHKLLSGALLAWAVTVAIIILGGVFNPFLNYPFS